MRIPGLPAAPSVALSSSSFVPEDIDAFTELEHKNWQRGVDAYANGFGSLTSRSIPTLLDSAGFLSSTTTTSDGGNTSLLDVACGPGQVVAAAISKAQQQQGSNENPSYFALDFSSNFLKLARANLEAEHPGVGVEFVEGDAQDMSVFGDESFTSVTSNFGILHLVDPDAFLAETYRVLKPGGRLAFSAWSSPPDTEGFELILGSVRDAGNPGVALPDGPPFFRFSDEDEIRRSLEAVGFVDVDVSVVESMEWTNVGSSEQLYDILLEGTARTRELLLGQTAEETEAVRNELERRFEELVEEGSSGSNNAKRRHLRMPAVVSSGRKPW